MLSTKVNMLLEFVIGLNRKQNYVVNYLNLVIIILLNYYY